MKVKNSHPFPDFFLCRAGLVLATTVAFLQSFSCIAQWQIVGGNGLKTSAVNSIDFYDALHGVAYGSGDTAYFTGDAGENWTSRRVFTISGGSNKKIRMVGRETYYATFYQSISGQADYQHCFLSSVDGPVLTSESLIEGSDGPGICLDSTHWVNVANLDHTGNYKQYKIFNPVSSGNEFYTSSTCEVAWDAMEDTCRISSMALTPGNLIYFTRGTRIIRTRDFTLQNREALSGSYNGSKIEAPGDSILYSGPDGLPVNGISKSTDEGITWNNVASGVATFAFTFVHKDTGFVAKNASGMLHTYNGGASWQVEPLPAGILKIRKFARVGKKALYAIDFNGKVLRNTKYTHVPVVTEAEGHLDENCWSLYPNPITEILHISGPSPIKDLSVSDALGRKIDVILLDKRVNVSHLVPGLYSFRILTTNGLVVNKWVKK